MRPTGWRLYNETRGALVAERVLAADHFFSRLRGLIGHPPLEPGTVLWIKPCQQVHTHFMRWPLQVVFVDRGMRVLRVVRELRPWRVSPWVRGAHSALEASTAEELPVLEGETLSMQETGRQSRCST
jgi:uncharacterized membrane protein (UPF0127 family)